MFSLPQEKRIPDNNMTQINLYHIPQDTNHLPPYDTILKGYVVEDTFNKMLNYIYMFFKFNILRPSIKQINYV